MLESCPDHASTGLVLLHDPVSGHWQRFAQPQRVVTATETGAVVEALNEVERAAAGGLHAAGFVSYDAGPGFDAALTAKRHPEFPLLWFGLYEQVTEVLLPRAAEPPAFPSLQWEASVTPTEYHAALLRLRDYIRDGDTYQVNFTYRLRTHFDADPWDYFIALMAAHAPPHGAFVDTGRWALISGSPELFFELDGNDIESRPMKGTAARGLTLAEDLEQAAALRASAKEQAENVMILDMVRNDIGRLAERGTVHVSDQFAVERHPTLWQMTSTVQAKTSASLTSLFETLFPPASITGAPKARTMEIIAELESAPRGIYTGAVGALFAGRRARFNVAIRTIAVDRDSDQAEYGVGGGIVWDSEIEREARECRTKARVLQPPPPPFQLLESLLWTPEDGLFLLEHHLRRLHDSATYFAFSLDPDAVRRELNRVTAALPPSRHKVRLLLSRDGGLRVETSPLPAGPGPEEPPLRVALATAPVNSRDPFLYHKTTHRRVYEQARAARPGYGDVILYNEHGEITEATIANVVIERAGQRVTPPIHCGLLAGTHRAWLLERGELEEAPVTAAELLASPRVWLLNSVRGLYSVEVDPATGSHE